MSKGKKAGIIVGCVVAIVIVVVILTQASVLPPLGPLGPSVDTSPEDAIIGTWQQTDVADSETLRFFVDGTMSTTKEGQSFGCDYTFIDKSQINLDCFGGLFGYLVYEIAISQDTLVMTNTETGEVDRYQRVQ